MYNLTMNILLAVPEFPPYTIGGGGEVYKQLANKYRDAGHNVTVVYGFYPNKNIFTGVKKEVINGITFYQIAEIPYPNSRPNLRTVMPPTPNSFVGISRIFKNQNFDVAHLHGYGNPYINMIAKKCSKANIPFVYTLHGYPESQNESGLIVRTVWDLFIKNIQNKNLENASSITTVSNYINYDSRNIFKNKSQTIYNGIEYNEFKEIQNEIQIRETHNISTDTTIIYSIGRIAKMKGFQEVIKRLPEMINSGMKVKYIIAGEDDGYLTTLKQLAIELGIENEIIFTGFQDYNTKKMYIKQCNFFAVPSLWEPFGLVALEGMVFNKAIISFESTGIKEVLIDYQNKLDLNDKDLINKMKSFSNSSLEYSNWSKFDWNVICNQYLEILKKASTK